MEGRVYERSNRTHFPFIIIIIIWAKVGGDGKKGRRKRVARGCQKREDRRGKRMIGGKRGERKGKCDPSRGEGGGGGVKDLKRDE